LYVVATPIGNLADWSNRAQQVLQGVDTIAAEDTRHSGKLLKHFGITTPMLAYHEHNEKDVGPKLIARLEAGESVALISDAGTPLLSDPGHTLVVLAQQGGLKVSPVPGPSALMAALSVAGLPTHRFAFEGFLPSKESARVKQLQALADEPRTLVFFEAPHRLVACLNSMIAVLGAERQAMLGRELTKQFETVRHDTLARLARWVEEDPQQQKGESVLVVGGAPVVETLGAAETERVLRILLKSLPVSQAAAIAAELTGGRKNQLYELALQLQS
jgi:16S rRNA (cytidine1402-2'-O)-methyltransferase